MRDIVFSIVTHGQENLVQNLIKSIDKFVSTQDFTLKLIVTENHEKKTNITSSCFDLEQIINLREKGFGNNHNCVFESYNSDFFFIINPDIEFINPLNLDKLIQEIEAKKVDICSPIIVDRHGNIEDYKRSNLTFYNLIRRVIFKKKEDQFDWLAGMFLIIKSSTFRDLSGFDTKFFMYVEDCDLCMRAKALNKNVSDLESLTVVHDAQRKSNKNLKYLKMHISSILKYWFIK